MLPAERIQKIIDNINHNKKVSVEELAKQLHVTPMTIRRDLQKLEGEQVLYRTHGGAVLKDPLIQEKQYSQKQKQNVQEKKKIAKEAIKMIHHSQTIFLDAGTTTGKLAIEIKRSNLKNLTIVTNDIDIAYNLHKETNIKVILIGGEIQKSTGALIGQLAATSLNSISVHIAFLATSSVGDDLYLQTPSESKVSLKKAMLKSAEKRILLVDASKFNTRAFYKILQLQAIECVITDYLFTDAQLMLLKGQRLEIINI